MKEEILDWRQAARLWSEGVEIEIYIKNGWFIMDGSAMTFVKSSQYRRKPLPVEPDWTLDQGFKEGDIVMVKNMHTGSIWHVRKYGYYANDKHYTYAESWTYARPLTQSEYSKVKVMP